MTPAGFDGGGVEGWGVGRHFISKGGSLYSRTILGMRVKDLTSGYKAFTRRALEAIDLQDVHSNGYSFQIELTYRGVRRGMRVTEVPIVFVDRTAGRSKPWSKSRIPSQRPRSPSSAILTRCTAARWTTRWSPA